MSFNKDALIHKLQDENENNMKEIVKEALYRFIDYYTSDELDRVDLKLIADNYIKDDCGKEE